MSISKNPPNHRGSGRTDVFGYAELCEMTVAALRKIASEREIPGRSAATRKADLIELIQQHQDSLAEPQDTTEKAGEDEAKTSEGDNDTYIYRENFCPQGEKARPGNPSPGDIRPMAPDGESGDFISVHNSIITAIDCNSTSIIALDRYQNQPPIRAYSQLIQSVQHIIIQAKIRYNSAIIGLDLAPNYYHIQSKLWSYSHWIKHKSPLNLSPIYRKFSQWARAP